ncbi:MAG: hypothetical protein ACJ8C4_13935 [Gemmataceae bacterium]
MVENCIHAANAFYLLSYIARDVLWLRILTCGGLLMGTVFFSCQAAPMYGPTAWHLLFVLINVVQIYRIVQERKRLVLTDEQRAMAEASFNSLSHPEMLTLLTRAICSPTACLPDLRRAARLPLSEEEQIVRDVALRSMSRQEMVHLLVRRLWHPLRWMNPKSWRFRRSVRTGNTPVETDESGTPR